MLRVGVLVSGGGTNLQAILDAVKSGKITNAEVVYVMSNNADAYALKRAENAGVEAECMSPKQFPDRAAFNTAMTRRLVEKKLDLIVLAGFLVTIPPEMIQAFRGSGHYPAGNDPGFPRQDHQHSSVPDPQFLRKRILRTEGA